MAYALARTSQVQFSDGQLLITLQVAYVGTDIPTGSGDQGEVQVMIAGDAQPASIRTLMSNAISADAQVRGFSVAGGNMTIPSFQKG